jgi:hypothetical protein
MKKKMFLFFALISSSLLVAAQMKIGDNPGTISAGSILELESTSKALTLPRMTTVQMQAIPNPLKGMIIFNTDSNCIYLYKNNNVWASINTGSSSGSGDTWPYHSNNQSVGTNGNAQGIISLTGIGLTASGNYSHAEGKDAVAYGDYSWSAGYADTAINEAAVALGYQNKVAGIYGFSAGKQNVVAYQSGVAMGQENRDTGWSSLAMGLQNNINNGVSYSNTLGYNNSIRSGSSHNALGESNNITSGKGNMVAGVGNTTVGNYNTLFGKSNDVLAGDQHFLAGDMNKVTSGSTNSLLGFGNLAEGNYLGAIGRENKVYFQSAVALGQGNLDSGYASIAGGLTNVINKDVQYSTVFGQNNRASGNLALQSTLPGAGTFTAGIENTNTGYASIALGSNNRSLSLNSLAANFNTISNGFAMTALGHYNDTAYAAPRLSFEPTEILMAIGNGFGDNSRRNSFTMLRNGFTSINTTASNGPSIPRAELDIKGTGALIVPVGTTSQRPQTPVAGMIRFCTDCPGGPVLQGYDGTNWVNL